eukprot:CAMPEP_0174841038 /NCGR_PEP_ID=MMETSP1114-20130205/9053_1 /TAXON_ID=312471 /ORGANISM="Neobodo designis, Strain CCAP 1951/1" /LENGTH=434 /DNA_ID=CAMNT_0016075207 /DNA_START=97 /DNA_END=1401 /DNA_ORIENTATION=+
MIRRTTVFFALLPVQPAMAVPRAQRQEEAMKAVKQLYGSRWLVGASTEYMKFGQPQSHFVPFFLARGSVDAIYTATVTYRETRYDNKGNPSSTTTHRSVPATKIFTRFFDHNTQIYAGYRRDPKHVRALQGEHLPSVAKPLEEVDVAAADDMNAVEMSLSTLESELDDLLTEHMTALAKKQVRKYHASADSVRIHWEYFKIRTEAVTPVFVPAWIVPIDYGDDQYKAVVCGLRGNVSAPRLYNPEAVARIAAGATFVTALALARMGAVTVFGATFPLATAASALASYYGGFWAAQRIPAWRVSYRRRQQEQRMKANLGDDNASSTGKQKKSKTDSAEWKRAQHADDKNDAPNPHPNPQDPKGYYKALGVSRFASTNEIKAAFRKRAMKLHPDVVGRSAAKASTDGVDMATLNAAYQVLRRPAKRFKYDSGETDL